MKIPELVTLSKYQRITFFGEGGNPALVIMLRKESSTRVEGVEERPYHSTNPMTPVVYSPLADTFEVCEYRELSCSGFALYADGRLVCRVPWTTTLG